MTLIPRRLAAPFFLALLLSATLNAEEKLNVTISGDHREKAELETLAPPPKLPTADEMTFSLDGGKSAVEKEVIPMSVTEAALKSDLSRLQLPVLPMVPEAPFLVMPVPPANDPSLKAFRSKKTVDIAHWTFYVVDEENKEHHRVQGEGAPPSPLVWDGHQDGKPLIEPDKTYFPFLILKSSSGVEAKIPGEAARYLGYFYPEGKNEVIVFGERLYQRDGAAFSREGEIYLLDVSRRLYLCGIAKDAWSISIYEPAEKEDLGEARRQAWRSFLQKTLGRGIAENQVVLYPSQNGLSQTKIILRNFSDPSRPVMTGNARDPRPQLEDKSTWIRFKEDKNALIIEMRHDRLFRPGSAYLRDEALPLVADALAQIRNEAKMGEKREIRDGRQTRMDGGRTVVLRSTMERPRIKGETFEEDPKLAALRTKTLFMLFSQERFLPAQ